MKDKHRVGIEVMGSKVDINAKPSDLKVEYNLHPSDHGSGDFGTVYKCIGDTRVRLGVPKVEYNPNQSETKVEFNPNHSEHAIGFNRIVGQYPCGYGNDGNSGQTTTFEGRLGVPKLNTIPILRS